MTAFVSDKVVISRFESTNALMGMWRWMGRELDIGIVKNVNDVSGGHVICMDDTRPVIT